MQVQWLGLAFVCIYPQGGEYAVRKWESMIEKNLWAIRKKIR